MSWLTVIWTICTTASAMLGVIHVVLWIQIPKRRYYIFSSLACFGAAAAAWSELSLMKAASYAAADVILVWQNVTIAVLIISLTWFVRLWFGMGSKVLAVAITAIWAACLVNNFVAPGNLVFSEITVLGSHETVWGERYAIAGGVANPFRFLADFASLLFLIFVVEASIRLARRGNPHRACFIGGIIVFFILSAGVHTPLLDAGIIRTPYLVGFFFLAIVLGLSYQLIREVTRATEVSEELRRVRGDLEHIGRVNLLGELSASLAHELNQPLTAILSNAQAGARFLEADEPDIGEIGEIFKDIVGDDKRARSVILRMRSLLEKGKAKREPTDINHAVEEAVTMLESELKRNGVSIELDLDPQLPPVMADRLGIQQVVVNFLLNAERAAAKNGGHPRKVHVTSRLGGDFVSVNVEDNGSGIDPEVLTRVFEPFFSTESSGLGMGLSICRTIIENGNGKISAGNREGGGAIFSFSLPLDFGERGS